MFTKLDPAQAIRIEESYRRRGDGLIVQTMRQVEERQPQDEDVAWARGLIEEMLGTGGVGDWDLAAGRHGSGVEMGCGLGLEPGRSSISPCTKGRRWRNGDPGSHGNHFEADPKSIDEA